MFMGPADKQRSWRSLYSAVEVGRRIMEGEGSWSLGLGVATTKETEVRRGIIERTKLTDTHWRSSIEVHVASLCNVL